MMASPGKVASHQPVMRYSLPSARDIPQLGVGGGTPRPRNDSVDSSTMRRPISVVMMTSAYETTFGRRCRPRIHHAGQPRLRADWTKSDLAEAQRLAAHDPSVRHPAAEREDHQEVPEARAEDGDDGDREEQEREGELDVDELRHHRVRRGPGDSRSGGRGRGRSCRRGARTRCPRGARCARRRPAGSGCLGRADRCRGGAPRCRAAIHAGGRSRAERSLFAGG